MRASLKQQIDKAIHIACYLPHKPETITNAYFPKRDACFRVNTEPEVAEVIYNNM